MPNWHTAGKSSHIAMTTKEDKKWPNCATFKSQAPQRLHSTIWTPQRIKTRKTVPLKGLNWHLAHKWTSDPSQSEKEKPTSKRMGSPLWIWHFLWLLMEQKQHITIWVEILYFWTYRWNPTTCHAEETDNNVHLWIIDCGQRAQDNLLKKWTTSSNTLGVFNP
jgi:hypothetical protein